MLTIYQIFRNTPELRIKNTKYLHVVKVKKGKDADGRGFIAAQVYTDKVELKDGTIITKANPNKYIAMITFLDQKLHCHVACSCLDFCMRSEYVLEKNDAAIIEYSNGEPAKITNPNNIPYCCKHINGLYFKIAKYLPKEQQPK